MLFWHSGSMWKSGQGAYSSLGMDIWDADGSTMALPSVDFLSASGTLGPWPGTSVARIASSWLGNLCSAVDLYRSHSPKLDFEASRSAEFSGSFWRHPCELPPQTDLTWFNSDLLTGPVQSVLSFRPFEDLWSSNKAHCEFQLHLASLSVIPSFEVFTESLQFDAAMMCAEAGYIAALGLTFQSLFIYSSSGSTRSRLVDLLLVTPLKH